MQFLCEDVDLAGQVGVDFQLELLSFKVVVGLGLLEGIPPQRRFRSRWSAAVAGIDCRAVNNGKPRRRSVSADV
ncbi:MAG: hypothetical protein QOG14_1227 [Mycobacterium sp.]|jgi:hypothetical protein|nr:hypothetical protein [Mycobacterium sp.]